MPVLYYEWAVQPEFMPEGGHLLWSGILAQHDCGWVSRHNLDQEKGTEGDNYQNYNGLY